MPSQIRNLNHVPPGNYYYKLILVDGQEHRFFGPCKGNPQCRLFGPSPTIDEVATQLARFRGANHLPRATKIEASEDISRYTCERIGNNPQWCVDTEQSLAQMNPGTVPAPCATCGHQLT